MNVYRMTLDELARGVQEATLLALKLMPGQPELVNLLLDAAETANMEMHVRTFDRTREEAEREFRARMAQAQG